MIHSLHPHLDLGANPANHTSAEFRPRGLTVFTAGHSFHVFIAPLLTELAGSAGILGHVALGTQFLGGSRTIQHWERPDALNEAKRALLTRRVEVLTLSPTIHPDPGIAFFTRLAQKQHPNARVTVQASWVPFDGFLAAALHGKAGRDALTGDDLRRMHAPYFHGLHREMEELAQQYGGTSVLSLVPVGQALIALREHIRAGRAPGLRSQEELFTDGLGHPALPVQLLAAYAHFAVIYRQSPVGLPLPSSGTKVGSTPIEEGLNRLLQELAWETVLQHPLSGITVKT